MHAVAGHLSQVTVVKDRGRNLILGVLYSAPDTPRGWVVAKIRVVFADAHQQRASIVRQALGEESEEFEVVGTAEDEEQAIKADLSLNPDALVIDTWMPILNGLQAAK